MKKGLIAVIAVVAVIIVLIISVIGGYNGIVESQENVETAKSNISTQLQRRADLIPNFVETVKSYKDYESQTYKDVTAARSAVAAANTTKEQQQASEQLDKAISVWVNAVTENYPDLKASEQYRALQDELSGTENRVLVARKDYNESAKKYNTMIRKFPKNILSGIFGFEKYDYFENDASAESVPKVSFD
ncbi:MAG: LemA family protein [Clostridia bacterium]|nr:LemA family protein [Clostridia bacterium]